ncbi:MAG: hypothetical protein HY289_05820, partial [Planctomycetes bacterium]|nr:hypothetical protein [Planctomycetota bacterium]
MNVQRTIIAAAVLLSVCGHAFTQPTERKVAKPTRLDWEFAVIGFGKGAAKLPAGYDSGQQKYQLYVPKGVTKDKPVGLVLFISPGDSPTTGLAAWRKTCDQAGLIFAAPFTAGNSTPPGQRTRIILDVLDDVRRQYAIDPDQTYITGFSGGGRMSCSIGFA